MTNDSSTADDDSNASEPEKPEDELANVEATEPPAASPDETANESTEAEPDTEAPSSDRRYRFPGWDVVSGTSGIVAVILSVAVLVVALLAWLLPRNAAPAAADLQVVKADVSRLQEIEFKIQTPDGVDYPSDVQEVIPDNVQDLVIDVQLFNQGGSPVLIEEIAARVLFNRNLQHCPGVGGGLYADIIYDIRIRAEPDNLEPVVVQRAFQVAPNSYDRLAVSVGPYGADTPYVYTVQLDAVLADSADHVDLGTFTLVNPMSSLGVYRAEAYSGDPQQADCIRSNAENLREAMRFGGTVAPEVLSLADRFLRAIERLDAGQPLIAPGDDSDPPASRNLPQCERANHPTIVLFEQHADVTGDGRVDIVLVQACDTDKAPREVTFFDGIDLEKPQVLLGSADGVDGRGLASAVIMMSDGVVTVSGSAYRASDDDSNASLFTVDSFFWDGTHIARRGERLCIKFDEINFEENVVPCTP